MKQNLNIKELLKATIAIGVFALIAGGVDAANSRYWEDQDCEYQEDVYAQSETQEGGYLFDQNSFIEEDTSRTTLKKASKRRKNVSLAASSPSKPRVMPVKTSAGRCLSGDCANASNARKTNKRLSKRQNAQYSPTATDAYGNSVDVYADASGSYYGRSSGDAEAPHRDGKKFGHSKRDRYNRENEQTAVVDELITEDTPLTSEDTLVLTEYEKTLLTTDLKKLTPKQRSERARLLKKMQEFELGEESFEEEQFGQFAENEGADDGFKEGFINTRFQYEDTFSEDQNENDNVSEDDVKDWVAAEGTTLRSLLMEWGNLVGWRVVWNMDRDYTLEAGAVFRGRFVDVSAALLRSFARATPAPKGVFYKGNKVLVISTREDENAD